MPAPAPDRILSTPSELSVWRDEMDAQGKKIVFTNGCFDLLHPGHTRYLQQARDLGDGLVIGLNSDASVRELKGANRPVNNQLDRAEVLRALRSVDAVVVFHEPRATGLIDAIRPHIYSKGGDYTEESLNPEERAALKRAGTEIRILPLVEGKSTTSTIKRMNSDAGGAGGAGATLLKLGILGSGDGSNLQSIIDAISSCTLDAEIRCAITDNPDSGFLRRAKAANVPVHVVDPGPDLRRFPEHAQKEVCEHLQRADVDLVVLTGFMRLIKEPTLTAFKDRIINLHPSLLPKFKGANAVQQAIDDGELESGTTIHLVTAALDAGPILAQERVPIHLSDTASTLHARIKEAEHKLLIELLSEWSSIERSNKTPA